MSSIFNNIQGKKGCQFSQSLRGVNLEQVLVVAIDAAKFLPKALICNYFGDVIEPAFFFSVDKVGLNYCLSKVAEAITISNAQKIFIGVEATGHYYEDIVRFFGAHGHNVAILNAATTHEERASALNWCKTDDRDLVAIAYSLKNNKATESQLPTDHYRQLLALTRARRQEVRKRSLIRMEMRNLMDKIFRSYQGIITFKNNSPKKVTIFSDFFGKSSRWILKNAPHPSDIIQLGEFGLRHISKEHNLKLRQTTIQKLLQAAENTYTLSKEELKPELLLLQLKLQDLERMDDNIVQIEKEMEILLLKTDGYLLLTITGIGVVTAAELFSEIGDISNFDSASQLIKKAGTNPMVKQSGGQKGYYGRITKQGNKHLRYVLYQAGRSICRHNDDLRPFFDRLKQKGKHSKMIFIAMGNKLLKIAFAMLTKKQPFHSKTDKSIKDQLAKKLKQQTSLELLPA